MSTLKLTVLAPLVNIRRGVNNNAGRIGEAKTGQQFDVIQVIDLKTPEQWAKVFLPEQQNGNAYICVTLPTGVKLCDVSFAADPDSPTDKYNCGWNDCLDAMREKLDAMRK